MTCPQCKTSGISETASFCATCGFALRTEEGPVEYAGFGRRLAAFWIDHALLTAPVLVLALTLYPPTEAEWLANERNPFAIDATAIMSLWSRLGGVLPFYFLLLVVYHMVMNCSPWQGSLGKRLMKLQVVNGGHRRLALPQAALRQGCWILSLIPAQLGFLWMIWEPRRRAFHDMLAGTFVIYDPGRREDRGRPRAVPPPLPVAGQRVGPPPVPVRVAPPQPPPIPR